MDSRRRSAASGSRRGGSRQAARRLTGRTASPLFWCLVGHRVSWRSLRIDSAAARRSPSIVAAGVLPGEDDGTGRVDDEPGGVAGGHSRERVGAGALGAVPGHQQERVGQHLAHRAELGRRGGAGDRAHVAVAGLADVGGAELPHQVGDAQEQRPSVHLHLLQQRGAGIARAREDEDAVAGGAVVDQRLERVVAQVGAGGDGVGADARRPGRRSRRRRRTRRARRPRRWRRCRRA